MNWPLLLNWVTLICSPLGALLLLAWVATGRQSEVLRFAGAILLLIGTIAFGLTTCVLR